MENTELSSPSSSLVPIISENHNAAATTDNIPIKNKTRRGKRPKKSNSDAFSTLNTPGEVLESPDILKENCCKIPANKNDKISQKKNKQSTRSIQYKLSKGNKSSLKNNDYTQQIRYQQTEYEMTPDRQSVYRIFRTEIIEKIPISQMNIEKDESYKNNKWFSCSNLDEMTNYKRPRARKNKNSACTNIKQNNFRETSNNENFKKFVNNFKSIKRNLQLKKSKCNINNLKKQRRNSLNGIDQTLIKRFENMDLNLTKTKKNKVPRSKIKGMSSKTGKNEKNKENIPKSSRQKKTTKGQKKPSYPDYIENDVISNGLENGTYIKGVIRINPKNFNFAYVSTKIDPENDIFINSIMDRNRALEGDEVIVKVKPEKEWADGKKSGVIIGISKTTAQRTTIGNLYLDPRNKNFAMLYPRDKKFPLIQVPQISWPNGFAHDCDAFSDNLFLAKITEWTNAKFAKGLIIDNLGKSGDLQVETQAILKSWGLVWEPFKNDLYRYLPSSENLLDEWLKDREDLRKSCIFTIDPLTARDLDDAVSCRELDNGNFEVGVHIADVSFYLEEGTSLDQQVRDRATTVYLVDNVYHMLPIELCLNCSLLPGKDKLAFSVIWELTPEGEIVHTRFAKTVINSCVQLAYEHAQKIIEGDYSSENFPSLHNGFEYEDIKQTVLRLYTISQHLRSKRFEKGALQIGQIKLGFHLDAKTGLPTEFFVYQQKESHRLIEEFMLLANMSVAKQLVEKFPDIAFLRMHEPPKANMLENLRKLLETFGIHLDPTSSKTLHSSLSKYTTEDYYGQIRRAVINHLLTKPMKRARYICASMESNQNFWHYALNVPLYTHFTSPIRRYADIMVHRLLAACLGICEKPNWDPEDVADIAENCNFQKNAAKRAGEDSIDLYLHKYIQEKQPYLADAAVIAVREKHFDLLILNTGTIIQMGVSKLDNIEAISEEISNDSGNKQSGEKSWRIRLIFPKIDDNPQDEIVLEMFLKVAIQITIKKETGKIAAKILRPIRSTVFNRSITS